MNPQGQPIFSGNPGRGTPSATPNPTPTPTPSAAPAGPAPVSPASGTPNPAPIPPQPQPARPVMPTPPRDTGDIIIGTPKKSKKPFIICGIVAAVAAIILVIILLIITSNNSNRELSLVESRNQFVNYYLFGKASTDALTAEYDSYGTYSIETAFYNNDQVFMEQAKNYFDQFYSKYRKHVLDQYKKDNQEDNNSEEDELEESDLVFYQNRSTEGYAKVFNFIYAYSKTHVYDDEELLSLLLDKGADETYDIVESNYEALLDTDYDVQKTYAENIKLYNLAGVDMFVIYRDAGCIVENDISNDCEVNLDDYDMSRVYAARDIFDDLDIPEEILEESIELTWNLASEEYE